MAESFTLSAERASASRSTGEFVSRRSHNRDIRNLSESFILDIEGCIQITLVDRSALLTYPCTISKCQVFLDPSTMMAGFGAGIPAIYQLHIPTILLSFVEQLPLYLEETGITHRLC